MDNKTKLKKIPIEPYFSRQKLKITGDLFYLSKFKKDYMVGSWGYKRIKEDKVEGSWEPEKEVLSEDDIRAKSFKRAKTKLLDYINTNVYAWKKNKIEYFTPVFLTLTFEKNEKNIEVANYEYTKFIQRLNWECGFNKSTLKYVTVIEFQKRGAVHYHCVFFNLPYIWKSKIEEIWSNGLIKIRKIDESKNVGFYVTKYMSKEFDDPRLHGRKSYFVSRGLLKPTILNIEELINLVIPMIPTECLEIEVHDIHTKYLSYMDFWRYNLKLYPENKRMIKELLNKYL